MNPTNADNGMLYESATRYGGEDGWQDDIDNIEEATKKVLANTSLFTAQLAEVCCGRDQVDSDWATRIQGRMLDEDDATVLHSALIAADRGDAETCLEAMQILTQRYIERENALIFSLSIEIAEES